MPEIEIRPAIATDIPRLTKIEHNYTTEYVWQMEIQCEEHSQIDVRFRQIRLPRSVRVEYPRVVTEMQDNWEKRDGLLLAELDEEAVAYISLGLGNTPRTTWVSDLAVAQQMRRKGIASALIMAGQEWGLQRETKRMVLEIQPKNYAAIQLAQKLGFDFCGYNERYYANQDIALFFAKSLR